MGNFRHRYIGNTINIYSKISSLEGSYSVNLGRHFFDCMNFNEEGLFLYGALLHKKIINAHGHGAFLKYTGFCFFKFVSKFFFSAILLR